MLDWHVSILYYHGVFHLTTQPNALVAFWCILYCLSMVLAQQWLTAPLFNTNLNKKTHHKLMATSSLDQQNQKNLEMGWSVNVYPLLCFNTHSL